jgi:multidrug efflux pump subunit AcrA (membrane-fusion protein)
LKISWLAEEGRIVEQGEPVVRFDETDAQISLEQSQKQFSSYDHQIDSTQEKARSRMEILEMDQAAAGKELVFAESQIRRDEDIFSLWEIQESLMSAALARFKKDTLESRTKLQGKLNQSDLQILNIEQGKAQAEMNLAKETLSALVVSAPVKGVLIHQRIRLNVLEVGTVVWPGQPLGDVASMDQFRGVMQVAERDISRIAPGQKVNVVLEGFPHLKLGGIIERVARVAKQIGRGDPKKYFECELILREVRPGLMRSLKPGMAFRAEVQAGQWPNAAVLPKSAVIRKASSWTVFVEEEDGYEEKQVEVAASDHGFYVVEGLEDGQVVCLRHPSERRQLVLPDFSAPAASTQRPRFVIFE